MRKIQKVECELPEGMNRVETGALEIGDDWPGTYVRGDESFMYANYLARFILNPTNDPISRNAVIALVELLGESNLNDDMYKEHKKLIEQLRETETRKVVGNDKQSD